MHSVAKIFGRQNMKMTLLVVGKTVRGWASEAVETYISRLRRYVPFSVEETKELKNLPSLGVETVKVKEGELLLKALRPTDYVVLLDERGHEYSSTEWARFVEERMVSGRDVVFVTGGAYGFSDAVYERADAKVSLSRMTFTHQMVRLVFVEQLYRAFTIIKGEPYHHE